MDNTTFVYSTMDCPRHHRERMEDLNAEWDRAWDWIKQRRPESFWRERAESSKSAQEEDRQYYFRQLEKDALASNLELYELAKKKQHEWVDKSLEILELEWPSVSREQAARGWGCPGLGANSQERERPWNR